MTSAVKRTYASPRREAQARETRRAIVEAASRLFVERGYGQTTVDAIAEAAGVSRKTVFTSVGGKPEALKLALDWAVVGDDEPVPMLERPHVAKARQEPDARVILRDYARTVREVSQRMSGLDAVVQAAAGLDADIRALADEAKSQRITGMRVLAGELAARHALRPGLTEHEAADVLWLLNDPAVYHRLVTERRWSAERYEDWLADAFLSLLIAPGYRPTGRPRRPRASGSP